MLKFNVILIILAYIIISLATFWLNQIRTSLDDLLEVFFRDATKCPMLMLDKIKTRRNTYILIINKLYLQLPFREKRFVSARGVVRFVLQT